MGEAKRRGTFEQRKAEGERKAAEVAKLRAAYEATRPKPKMGTVTTTAILGMLAMAMQEQPK